MLDKNPDTSIGFTLAADMVYAARHELIDTPKAHAEEEWKNIAINLKRKYGEILTVDEVRHETSPIITAASALGSIRTEKKAAAARENGKKGGRPAMEMKTWCVLNNENGAFFGTVDAKTWKKALTLAYDVYSRDRRFTLDVIGDAEYREKLGLSRP
jgi:hypothetical protein